MTGVPALRPGRPSPIVRVQKRVDVVVPSWNQWPRKLRRIYVLLETFGSSDASIGEMCNEFRWDLSETMRLIDDTGSFVWSLEEYRKKGCYPKAAEWRYYLRASELHALYAYESAIVQFMHLEDRRGQGSFGVRLIDQTGLLGEAGEGENGAGPMPPAVSLPDWAELEEAVSEKA